MPVKISDSLVKIITAFSVYHIVFILQNNGDMFPKDKNGKFIYDDTDYVDTWKVSSLHPLNIVISALINFLNLLFKNN